MATAVLVGFTAWASPLVFLFGALGMVAFASSSSVHGRSPVGGVLMVGLASLVSGLLTGFGWLEISGVLASFVATVWILLNGARLGRAPIWAPVVAIGALVLFLVPLVVDGGALGHDESAYALMAKSWLFGTPESGWGLHRRIGMSIYAYPVLALGGLESALRVLGLASLLGLAMATWWLGRRLGNSRTGALAAVVVLASPPLLRRATEFLSDIPAAALLVVVMVIVWREFGESEAPSYRLLWLLPFAWSAFYLRYQSILSLALIAVTILVLWWRKAARRPGPLIFGALVGFLGLIPHFIFANTLTGSALGIMTYAGTSGGRDFSGDGLLGYSAMFGWRLAFFIGPLMIGLLGWWLIASWRDVDIRTKALFLVMPAAARC